MPHPDLWPAIIGAIVGIAFVAWLCLIYARAWDGLSQRKRWLYGIAIAVFETAIWLNVYAWLIEPNMLVVRHVEIVSGNWRGAPITIAALSDTHVASPHVSAARMRRIVARVNELRPDLVVLLGDYAGGHEPEAMRFQSERSEVLGGVAAFAELEARYGVIGVIGNHNSWFGRPSIERALQGAGVATLWNQNVVIDRLGGDIVVAGLADEWTGEPDFNAALQGAPPDAPDIILLAHSPDSFANLPAPHAVPMLGAERYPAIMLAGHGHCGQVTIPLLGRPVLPLRNKHYGCHLIHDGGKTIYATGGIGTSILPVRFLNPPEIVLITLRSGAAWRRRRPHEFKPARVRSSRTARAGASCAWASAKSRVLRTSPA